MKGISKNKATILLPNRESEHPPLFRAGLFSALFVLLAAFGGANASLCEPGWRIIDPPYDGAEISGCARAYNEPVGWNTAKMKCVGEGAKLMEVNSPRENDLAGKLMDTFSQGRRKQKLTLLL